MEAVRVFYDKSGISKTNTTIIGNQSKAFDNLYRRNENNQIIPQFKNPWSNDFEDNMKPHEKEFLKWVIYRLARIRSLRHGIPFNFNGANDPDFKTFVDEHLWTLNVPLKKARKATERSRKNLINRLKDRATNVKKRIKNLNKMPTTISEKEDEEDIYDWTLNGEFSESDGIGDSSSRNRILNQHPIDYWETDLESLVIDFQEDYIRAKELNKALIEIKAILLHLEMLGDSIGKKEGMEQTIKMIHDFVQLNFFEKSLLKPEMKELIDTWITPFKTLVSRAYIAGNIVSMFRDTIEGILQNYTRTINKFNTDLSAKNISKAYSEVILNMCHDTTSLNKMDQLCKLYRLSNSDISRISEQLKSGRGGFNNYENWMYATLRRPDFLNRMVLFVARCMQDGTWDAFSINEKTGEIKYDWKKDKRFKAYAENSSNKAEYEKAKEAYYNAIMDYNKENDTHITPKDGLPTAYTNSQIEQIRELSNNIYGSYDKAMKSAYERTAGGIIFGSFTTWMNGMWNNYARVPGIYDEYTEQIEQETDANGNNVFIYEDSDGNLINVVEVIDDNGNKSYMYQDTGNPYTEGEEKLKKRMKYVPEVVQGIYYTLRDAVHAINEHKFKENIWNDPKQRKNLDKLLSDLIGALLFAALFKLAISPAYKEYTKHKKENNPVTAGLAYVMYNSSSRSYDGFLGPVNVLTHIGNNSNPPFYQLPAKIVDDLGNFVFGNRTWDSVVTGNVAIFRIFQESIKTMRAQN